MKDKVNFFEMWETFKNRNKTHIREQFQLKTGMKRETFTTYMSRRNFTIQEQRILSEIIGIPFEEMDFSNLETIKK